MEPRQLGRTRNTRIELIMNQKYAVGTQFKPIGKDYICTVTDLLTTTNLAGEVVRVVYRATHTFFGQTMTAEYVETTISRALSSFNKLPVA